MTTAQAYRRNADGSVTITAHRLPVRISARRVALNELFGKVKGEFEPSPAECWSCKAKAMYVTKERRAGPELALITYQCGECGMKEVEPFD